MRTFLRAVAGAAILCAAPAWAAEHVVNGGFETGDFTGFTESDPYGGDPGLVGVDAFDAHSGDFGAYFGTEPDGTFGNPTDYDTLTQSIATVAGQSYTISFWLSNGNGITFTPAPTDSATVTFGGQTLLALTAPPPSPYTRYSYTATAAGSSTLLSFRFSNLPYYWSLDDISVADAATTPPAVPEAATWAMLLVGFGLTGATVRTRGRTPVAA